MENVHQVILFCDIANFMRAAQTLGQGLAGFIQEFYESVGSSVVDHGGQIMKYIGDSILCVFPAGCEGEAVQCARSMRRDFQALLARHSLGGRADLGVSISAGEVTRGKFGHSSLRLDDVFGNPVAHAAVLLQNGGISITESVWKAVRERQPTEELPPITPKWQAEPLRAWKVVE